MGLDCEFIVEARVGEQWQMVDQHFRTGPADRNYPLYAILANARDLKIAGPARHISGIRGIPDDSSPELRAVCRRRAPHGDEVFCSWVSLRELLEFDWSGNIFYHRCYVDQRAAFLFPPRAPGRRGWPYDEWPEGVENASLERRYCGPIEGMEFVFWHESYREAVEIYFVDQAIPKLQEFGAPDDVRLILLFNN